MMGLLQVVGTEKSGQDMAGAVYAYVKCIRFQFTWPNLVMFQYVCGD